MNKELIAKVEHVTDISQSEKDRLNVQEVAHDVLVNFLLSHVRKVTKKNSLKTLIEDRFVEMIENPGDDPLPLPAILKIYEILAKSETDADTAILALFQRNEKLFANATKDPVETSKETPMSPEDMNKAVKFYNAIKSLEKSENPENIEE